VRRNACSITLSASSGRLTKFKPSATESFFIDIHEATVAGNIRTENGDELTLNARRSRRWRVGVIAHWPRLSCFLFSFVNLQKSQEILSG